MTIKELAEFTGKTERTIQRWLEKACDILSDDEKEPLKVKIVKSWETKKPSDFSIDEIELILNHSSMSKDAVKILMDNARKPTQIITVKENNNPITLIMDFMVKMQEQQQQFMSAVLSELKTNKQPESKQLSLPVTPDIEPRLYLNQLSREYASLKNVSYQIAWNTLYEQMLYRCKINVKVRAKNEGIRPIDYLDRENLLLTACSIVKSLING